MARPLGDIMIERNKGLELAVPIGSLEAYTQAVNRVPMLTAEEERALASRLRDHNDLEAARQLILAHLRFVVRVARGYDGYGLSQADLIQEGNVGLMKAVKRINPDMNVRLVSIAVHWIRDENQEIILRNCRIVKVATTKAHSAPIAYLADMRAVPAAQLESEDWEDHHCDKLHAALEDLDERSRDILSRRWLADNKATLHELADKYRVSAERIRQLEQNAIKKLKAVLAV